ncbi:kelch domain-containing protein [Plasmodium gonderi]|uniref:Kelch domain-containing protein n=1 Tax=Plasmodium gonderi TaxID=77519 RepID=A0A1Y1JE37_PLAGO|nr:kelch domain-containing protein [Plasmodium gonderi]GAW79928.1 kelch domain-containing protein [Plasmodium gonderi]
MGKKNKKSKEKQEKLKQKKEKQKLKSLKSKKKKNNNDINDALSDADFETICLYYENLNKKDKYGHINVNTTTNNTFVECDKPSPRSNSSVTFINEEEFLLFGGEYNDNNELIAYNDLFKYNIVKDKWKYYYTTSKKPKPRCSHQAVYFNKKLYIFGGELCTNTQFFHYSDFWSFDLKNNSFEEIECKNKRDEKPSPRSGHRMILWKSCIIMFGGFFDNGRSVEYFNDLYMYIISSNKWVNLTNIYLNSLFKRLTQGDGENNSNSSLYTKNEKKKNKNEIGLSPNVKNTFFKNFDLDSYMPSKRSSVSLFTDMKFQKVYIYGGYAQIKNTARNAIGIYYSDMWIININYLGEDNISVNFKKLKKSIFQPSKRIGFSTCIYKNSLILFGGVFDKVEKNNLNNITTQSSSTHNGDKNTNKNGISLEESLNMQSIFFNDLYSFDMNKEHWSYLILKCTTHPKEINKNSGENKKNKSEELKSSETHSRDSDNKNYKNGGHNDKHFLPEEGEPFSKNKKAIFGTSKDILSDSHDSSDFSDNNNDDEYYSSVFVYFDENGNKKTMKINREDEEGEQGKGMEEREGNKKRCEIHSEKKEFQENFQNGDNHLPNVKEETCSTTVNKVIDTHPIFIQSQESTHSNLVKLVDNLKNVKNLSKSCTLNDDKNGDKTVKEKGAPNGCVGRNDNNHSIAEGEYTIAEEKHTILQGELPIEQKEDAIIHIDGLTDSDSESNREDKKVKFVINDGEPIGRINSHIFVLNKMLHLFGGMYEYKNNEIMLSDHWKINIFKREKWELVHKGNLDDIYVDETDLSSSLSIDDEDKDEKEIENLIISNKIKKIENKIKSESIGFNFDANENLNEFFLRTKQHWLRQLNVVTENKKNRKDAFILCEQKYQALKKYHNKIQKYRELLLLDEYESSITNGSSSDNAEEFSS